MSIFAILDRLAKTPSRLEKEAILHQHAGNTVLRDVFRLAYSPDIRFGFRNVNAPDGVPGYPVGLAYALHWIEHTLATRDITGNVAFDELQLLLRRLHPDDRSVLVRVVQKDLRCGVSMSTIDKIWSSMIGKPKFMLAETDHSRIVYPAMAQIKEDGTRVKLSFNDGQWNLITRSGKPVEVHGVFDRPLYGADRPANGDVFDGELIAVDNAGNPLPRKVSNGIVNKAIKGTITEDEAKSLCAVLWDIETAEANYDSRFNMLRGLDLPARFKIVENKIVNSYEEAVAFFKYVRRAWGKEGIILKNLHAMWQPKRSYDCVKFKAEVETEFRVTGFDYGTGKNAGRIGALHVESECGQVKCKVGIFKDFDDSVRDDWLLDMPKIVTVLYNERIEAKGRETQSLFLPRVTSVRYDKTTANTLLEMQQVEKSVLED